MKKITFVGHFINSEMLGKFLGPAVSGNRMQLGIINELVKVYSDIQLLSVLPISSFPKERLRIEKSTVFLNDNTGTTYKQLSFINWPILKVLSIKKSLRKELFISSKQSDVIINFNPYYEIETETLKFCKKHRKKCMCIVADIPVTIPKNYGFIKKMLRRYEIRKYYAAIRKYDALIVLNKEVINEFKISKPYYLMDGGISDSEIEKSYCCSIENRRSNQILYTGALEDYNGVLELIEGFKQVKTADLQLTICGEGSLREKVEEIVSGTGTNNITYIGYVPNDEVKRMQAEAGLLISTRPIDRFALKLTFPSKIIEYMLSGTPVLTTRLNGLAESYDDYLYYCGQTPKEIAKAIEEFFGLDEEIRLEKANKARQYVINEKNYKVHAKGIIDLLERL